MYSLSSRQPGLVHTPTQWTMSDESTAHGCMFRSELNVIIGIHEGDNQLLCPVVYQHARAFQGASMRVKSVSR